MSTVFIVMFCLFAAIYMMKSAQMSFNMDEMIRKEAVAGAFILTALVASFTSGLGKIIEAFLGR